MILIWRFLFLALIFTPYHHTLASSDERAATQEENDVFNGISSEEEDYKDECTECQEKTKEKLEQALILKIIDESKFKESNTPNVLDLLNVLLKALSILVSDTNNKGVHEIIIQIKDGQNHLNKRFNYVLNSHDKRAKRQVNDFVNTNEIIPDNKSDNLVNNGNTAPNSANAINEVQNNLNTDQVNTNDATTDNNSNSAANHVQNNANTDVSDNDESAINNENGKQGTPNKFTESTNLENTPTNDNGKVSDDANLQNANVDNFQDDNVINSNDSSTNDTATAAVEYDNQNSQNDSLVIKEGNYNISFNNNNNETSNFAENNVSYSSTPNNFDIQTGSNTNNNNQTASSKNQSFNDDVNNTNYNLHSLTGNDNNNDFAFNNSKTLQNDPIGRQANVENVFNETDSTMNSKNFATENIRSHLENTFNNEQDKALNKSSNGNRNYKFDQTDASDLHNTTARIPLSSNQLSNLQNVLNEDFGVNNRDSQPVANFHLNKSNPDDKPVIVIVYNCSCNKNSANIQNQSKIEEEPTIDENGGNFGHMSAGELLNTRRMMHEDPNTEDNNPQNKVINEENPVPSSQSVESIYNTDISKVAKDKSNKIETKQTAASIENNLLIKCKSLLAVEAENAENFAKNRRYDDTSIKQENMNKEQVQDVKDQDEPENNHVNVTSSSENGVDLSNDTSRSDVATNNNNNVHKHVDFLSNLGESHNEDNNITSQNQEVNRTSQANNENEFSAVITTNNNNDEVNNNTELGAGDSSPNTNNFMNNTGPNDSNQQFNITSENTSDSPAVNINDNNNTDNSTFVPESSNNTENSNLVPNNSSLDAQNESNNTENYNLVTNESHLQNDSQANIDNSNDNGESSATSNVVSDILQTEFSTESSSNSQIDNKMLNSETSAQDVLRKRRNIEKDVEKRDVLANINDALNNILHLPSHGLDLISSTFETDDNTYNRSEREVIIDQIQAEKDLPIEDPLLKFLNIDKNNFHLKDSDENGVYKKESKEYFNSFNGDSTKEGNDGSNKMLTKLIKLLRPIEINVYLDVN